MNGKKISFAHICVLLLLVPCQASTVPLHLVIPSMQAGLSKLEQWTPMVEYLEQACGFEINLLIVKDHQSMADGLRDRFYDIGFMNALWQDRLIGDGGFEKKARAQVDGEEFFFTHIIVNGDSVIRKMAELSGEYLALTVPNESLGGYYIPLSMFMQEGIEPSEVFGQIVFSETYTSILKGVAFGVVDAGAVTSDVLSSREMEEYCREVRVVGTSESVPQWAMVAREDHKEELIDRFTDELIAMKASRTGQDVLEAAGFTGFVPVDEGERGKMNEYLKLIEVIDAFSR